MTVLFAFLHHLAAFTLVSVIAIEFVLLRGELTSWSARRLQIADMILGIAAGVLLVAGGARVLDRKSTRLNSSHDQISYAAFCLKKKRAPQALALAPTLFLRREVVGPPATAVCLGAGRPPHWTLLDLRPGPSR